MLIDQLDVTFILVFSLPRRQLQMVYLLLQGGCHQTLPLCVYLTLELTQLVHLIKVVFLRENHLCAGLVETHPDLFCLLDQDTIRCRVVFAVQV